MRTAGVNMQTKVIWKDAFSFDGKAQSFSIPMDASPPLGHKQGVNPKEIIAMGLAACTGMDVIGLVKKDKQLIDRFEIETQIDQSKEHPIVFSSVLLIFKMEGTINPAVALKAVELSQTVYCGVSAMLCTFVPIKWVLYVNDQKVGEGLANFEKNNEIFQTSYEG